jgi:hypothetical protein
LCSVIVHLRAPAKEGTRPRSPAKDLDIPRRALCREIDPASPAAARRNIETHVFDIGQRWCTTRCATLLRRMEWVALRWIAPEFDDETRPLPGRVERGANALDAR